MVITKLLKDDKTIVVYITVQATACRDVAMLAAFPSHIAFSRKTWDVLSSLQAFSRGQRG